MWNCETGNVSSVLVSKTISMSVLFLISLEGFQTYFYSFFNWDFFHTRLNSHCNNEQPRISLWSSIYTIMIFSPMRNSDHVAVWISIGFPTYSKGCSFSMHSFWLFWCWLGWSLWSSKMFQWRISCCFYCCLLILWMGQG